MRMICMMLFLIFVFPCEFTLRSLLHPQAESEVLANLNLLKNYLRSSMSQERLSSLAILVIENRISHELNYDKDIDLFAE